MISKPKPIGIYFTDEMKAWLAAEARRRGASVSQVVRDIIAEKMRAG